MKSSDKVRRKAGRAAPRKAAAPKREKTAKGSIPRISLTKGASAALAVLASERDEALEQQKAAFAVLRAISDAPTDTVSILGAIAESVARLLGVTDAEILMRVGDGLLECVSKYGTSRNWPVGTTRSLSRDWVTGRAVIDGTAIHVADLQTADEFPQGAAFARQYGHRTTLAVPLMREGAAIGAILIRRMEVKPFTEKQIELVSGFASQAVIAIENARLLNEVQANTRDLEESLNSKRRPPMCSRSSAARLSTFRPYCDTLGSWHPDFVRPTPCTIFLRDGDLYRSLADSGFSPEYRRYAEENPITPGRGTLVARITLELAMVHIPDVLLDAEYTWHAGRKLGGFRAMLGVPLLRERSCIGVMAMTRMTPRPFTDRQIELVKVFADQAVIAIENVRLFDEVKARTEDLRESLQQQTATADVLKAISRSTFDLKTVLQTLVASAARLCDADKATITRRKGNKFYRAESVGFSDEFMDYVRAIPVEPDRGSATARALLDGVVVHIPDVTIDPDYTFTEGQKLGDFRAILGVPMMREAAPTGVIVLTRSEPRPFSEKQIELATTFADQAAIAIENVRLFESVESRTRELAASLDDLRTAQDRLVQTEKLASLGQLTAGIAHEIKNPLNFVNNFSALSVELTDELGDVLEQAELTEKIRLEVNELSQMLKSNLEKVVQHGKRADSIVRNMLLHSREGSGERRSADINALVGESLNLAYHGARAEKAGFTIALEHDLDPEAGTLDLYPQEMVRALLNLISNGFYAATRRKVDAGDGTFEPAISAVTRNLGNAVEIRIRDNGTGIPPEVKEKMFNPFFTTKPTGEGTGLGLSMTHDIIVKQHGGRIDVETSLGEFTEFIITLPRDNRTAGRAPG